MFSEFWCSGEALPLYIRNRQRLIVCIAEPGGEVTMSIHVPNLSLIKPRQFHGHHPHNNLKTPS